MSVKEFLQVANRNSRRRRDGSFLKVGDDYKKLSGEKKVGNRGTTVTELDNFWARDNLTRRNKSGTTSRFIALMDDPQSAALQGVTAEQSRFRVLVCAVVYRARAILDYLRH